ncbi:MAG: AmmeMemoRadiSam system protein B [Anaerolineae bacterium]|nr:AmmeMemoRadiSam system protein B [Anaerolineae bacterium]
MPTAYADVRPSPLAGRWYPADPAALRELLDDCLRQADEPATPGRIVGLLAPHAGLIYSGPVAAHAYARVRGLTPDVVAVLSPSHHPYPAPLLTTTHDAYQTPLGLVPVDRAAVAALGERVKLWPVSRDQEHALEIELPFLQHVLPEPFKLLPVMMMDQSPEMAQRLALALADVLRGRDALLIASSDLSHFYPQRVAEVLDAALLARVAAFDPAGVFAVEQQGKGFACGRGAIAAVMHAARALGADTAEVIYHATSGDTSGDYTRVVGYGAGVFYAHAVS